MIGLSCVNIAEGRLLFIVGTVYIFVVKITSRNGGKMLEKRPHQIISELAALSYKFYRGGELIAAFRDADEYELFVTQYSINGRTALDCLDDIDSNY